MRSRVLPGFLEQAESAYRGSGARLRPVPAEVLAGRAMHFAAGVRLSVEEPQALRKLHEVTAGLRGASSLRTLLPRALDGALSLMGADFGNVQLLDPLTGSLGIVTQSGFGSEFLDYFAAVDDDHSACGRAASECAQIVIADVDADPRFAPHRGIAALSCFRAVQSTPMLDHQGRLVGVISTHFRPPHRPAALDLQIMELLADLVGGMVAGLLRGADGDGTGDLIGRLVISALLDPGDGQSPDVTAVARPGDAPARPVREPGLERTMAALSGMVVNRLFSIGLSMESARSVVGDGPAGDRLWAATQEIDALIRDIRTIMFSRAADAEKHSPHR